MKIEFTKKQYEILLRLVYFGNWVVNGFRTDDVDEDAYGLEDYLCGKARSLGLDKYVDYDEELDEWFFTAEAEESWDPELDTYKNDVFWDELEYRLADRDLAARFGEDYFEKMKPAELDRLEQEIVNGYYDEFVKNGLKNVMLVRPN